MIDTLLPTSIQKEFSVRLISKPFYNLFQDSTRSSHKKLNISGFKRECCSLCQKELFLFFVVYGWHPL